jgi:hypothetical protein
MTEGTMCYERRSFADKAAEAEKARQTKRTETVDTLLRDAGKAKPEKSPAEAPKEAAPAK